MPTSLRYRFTVAAGLLVLTTVVASVWTFFSLTRLSGLVTNTVSESESVTAVTSRLAGALEREDDAVLLILAGDARGAQVLTRERSVVDSAMTALLDVLEPSEERELANPLQTALTAYRRASDGVITVSDEREALVQYHQTANPLLRRAVALTTTIRDRHFDLARAAVAGARDEAAATRRAVLLITVIALMIAISVAWHLTHAVVSPVRRLTVGANAIKEGRFGERIAVTSHDELGELASAFNDMADDLAEFRRTNLGEVLRAKSTLEATLEALPDAVVLLDPTGRIQSMNRAAIRVLTSVGIDDPRTLQDLRLDGLDVDTLQRTIATGVDQPRPDLTRTIRIDHDGKAQRLLPRVVPVASQNPGSQGAVLLLYDVTELARLDEMRSELVAVASHEFQTPLTTLRMTLLMLQEGSEQLPKRHQELVATSLIGVEQLGEIVREFLDLTRIEAGELRLICEPLLLADVVAEAVGRVESQAREQGIELRVDLAPDVPAVSGDPVRLRAVFDNVLSNALKYTPQRGRVTVQMGLEPATAGFESVVTTIMDTGPGIPPEFRRRVFDKFFRLEHHQGDGRPGARGAGIGLYMSRQIIELHGGSISCRAGDGGHGTCIRVLLPAEAPASLVTDAMPTTLSTIAD